MNARTKSTADRARVVVSADALDLPLRVLVAAGNPDALTDDREGVPLDVVLAALRRLGRKRARQGVRQVDAVTKALLRGGDDA